MIRLLLTFAIALHGTTALSLSCMVQSGESLYKFAAEAPDPYLPVVGQFHFDEDQPQRITPLDADGTEDINARQGVTFQARIGGQALTRQGFTAPISTDVTIEIQCFGPWCGGLANDRDMLVLMKQTDAGYHVSADPCGGSIMSAQPSVVDAFVQCHKGGTCEVPER